MIGHYLQSALIHAVKAPFTTAAKVVTLAMGLMVFILATGVVAYWRSADRPINPAGDLTVIFTEALHSRGFGHGPGTATPFFLEKYLQTDIRELKTTARIRIVGNVVASAGDQTATLIGATAEPDILKIFRYRFLAGDPVGALRQSNGVILTQATAQRLFRAAPALGQTVTLTGEIHVVVDGANEKLAQAGPRPMVVTGVIAALPENAALKFDYLSAMPPDPARHEYWGNTVDRLVALLPADGSLSLGDLNRRLAQLVAQRKPHDSTTVSLKAIPLSRVAETGMNAIVFGHESGNHSVSAILFGLAGVILAVAGLNYANLATAQTMGRAKEIGLRRVLGAGRAEILLQNWVDAALATMCALILTLAGLWLAGPVIKAQTEVDAMGALFHDPHALGVVGLVAVGVILLAGLYPALLVLWIRPVDALRAGKVGGGPRGLGPALVGVQFISASGLLIGVLVIAQQNAHTRQIVLQHAADQVLYLPVAVKTGVTADLLRQQLASDPRIAAVSEVESLPWSPASHIQVLARSPQAVKTAPRNNALDVGLDYFAAEDQKLLAGRVFDPVRDQGKTGVGMISDTELGEAGPDSCVVDQAFLGLLGFPSPQAALDQPLYGSPGYNSAPRQVCVIVGVVEDRPRDIQAEGGTGTVFVLRPNVARGNMMVRLSGADLGGGLAAVKQAWSRIAPASPIKYQFEDQIFDENFKVYDRIGRLFIALSLVALLISSIGLFGMAVHVTQRRLHEIGVRKTLGSSVAEVVGLLLADFSKPVVIANLLAWPLAYWGAKAYLAGFAQRIDLTVWPFGLSLAITLAIAWLAVGGQTFRAARVRPAEVLRDA